MSAGPKQAPVIVVESGFRRPQDGQELNVVTKSRLNKPKRPSSKLQDDNVVACLSTSRARRAEQQAAALAVTSQAQSTEVVDLQSLKDTIDQLPEINASKVISLHNRINANEYEIDVAGLAEKLIAFEERLDH